MRHVVGLSAQLFLKDRKRYRYTTGLLIGLSVQFVLKDRKRYPYAMGLLIGLRARFFPEKSEFW